MPRRAEIAALCCCLLAAEARADITGSVALMSDYRFRGISYSDNQPSLQANLDWSSPSGPFIGVLASTVKLGRSEPVSGIGAQAYAGYAGSLTQTVWWSGGISAYVYPNDMAESANYQELFLRVGSERVQSGLYLSRDYYGRGAPAVYVTLSGSYPLTDQLTLFAQVGWLGTGHSDSNGTASERGQRIDGRAGLALNFGFATVEASVVAVTTDSDACQPDRDACKPALVLALRKSF